MSDRGFDYVDAIVEHSAGFAASAASNLNAPVEHCPGWTVADLVTHLTEVHWFWATIAAGRLTAPPDDSRRPSPPPSGELIATFESGARRLATVLRAADESDPAWTWAPAVAADAIEEFLTFSVSTVGDPAQPVRPNLDGLLALQCNDSDTSWTISDGGAPGTIAHTPGLSGAAAMITATASDLLLWLYDRISLDTLLTHADLIARFRALTFTD